MNEERLSIYEPELRVDRDIRDTGNFILKGIFDDELKVTWTANGGLCAYSKQ